MIWLEVKSFFKNILYFLVSNFEPRGATVLIYHSVSDRSNKFFPVNSKDFEKQVKFLKDNNFNVVLLNELINLITKRDKSLSRTVALTFDDGYEDNYFTVFPLLKRYNFPATIFLVTGLIGNKNYTNKKGIKVSMLDWSQIIEMHSSGIIDFQPHTITHPKLSKLSIGEAEKEILEPKLLIEKYLNKQCEIFAYPYGDFNENIKEIVSKYFKAALGVQKGIINPRENNLLTLPRNAIDYRTTFNQFKGIIRFGRI